MARRKVTMLEAFQRSARESAERAAAERRRVIAEREKEIRRAEAARAAQEFGSRISQRAGDSVGSILAGIRGQSGTEAVGNGLENAVGPVDTVAQVGQPAPGTADIRLAGPPAEQVDPANQADLAEPAEPLSGGPPAAPSQRSGPALPAFDRAHQGELATVAPSSGPPEAQPAGFSPAGFSPAGVPSTGSQPPEAELSPQAKSDAPETLAPENPFAGATPEDVEHAMASLEDDVFELPMSPKAFVIVSSAVLAAVFLIGMSFGSRDGDAQSPGDASPGGAFPRPRALARGPGSAFATPSRGGASPEFAGAAAPVRPMAQPAVSAPAGASSGASSGASPGASPGAPSPGAAPSAALPGADQGATAGALEAQWTAFDLAFRLPEKKFTILAITYSRTEAHGAMAMETYHRLMDQGFPAIRPVEHDRRIFVFVGAAETQGELEGLHQELKEFESGRGGSREFRSAYLVNIEPYR